MQKLMSMERTCRHCPTRYQLKLKKRIEVVNVRLETDGLVIGHGSIGMEQGARCEISSPTPLATGPIGGDEIEQTNLIDILNQWFGTGFKPGGQLFSNRYGRRGRQKPPSAAFASIVPTCVGVNRRVMMLRLAFWMNRNRFF